MGDRPRGRPGEDIPPSAEKQVAVRGKATGHTRCAARPDKEKRAGGGPAVFLPLQRNHRQGGRGKGKGKAYPIRIHNRPSASTSEENTVHARGQRVRRETDDA